ncbi:MAG: glycine zipper 2TM domain-containing protein [Flavisolibacter sp.]|nr:glycine zipper 2TM domain-containing protein [Flavisolibacter sp.]
MKKLITALSLATLLVACGSKQDKVAAENAKLQAYKDSLRLATDTAGLAQYQQWKAQHELSDPSEYNQTNQNNAATAPETRTVVKYVPVSKTKSSSRSKSYGSGSMSSTSGNTAKAPAKKGWSKAAKGAAIGGGAGAVVGAVVNKKSRVAGGVIGGAVGAGVGYGIGRHMDKKDGRKQ